MTEREKFLKKLSYFWSHRNQFIVDDDFGQVLAFVCGLDYAYGSNLNNFNLWLCSKYNHKSSFSWMKIIEEIFHNNNDKQVIATDDLVDFLFINLKDFMTLR